MIVTENQACCLAFECSYENNLWISYRACCSAYTYRYNTGHELIYFPQALTIQNGSLTKGFDALCFFVNDQANRDSSGTYLSNEVKI